VFQVFQEHREQYRWNLNATACRHEKQLRYGNGYMEEGNLAPYTKNIPKIPSHSSFQMDAGCRRNEVKKPPKDILGGMASVTIKRIPPFIPPKYSKMYSKIQLLDMYILFLHTQKSL
jgi:hypothetical protein